MALPQVGLDAVTFHSLLLFGTSHNIFSAGLDYIAVSQVLEFSESVNIFTIMVPISVDTLAEVDENFFGVLTLLDGVTGVTIDPEMAMITITDDDGKSPLTCD